MMAMLKISVRILILFMIILSAVSCTTSSTSDTNSKYDQLCKIYEDVVPLQIDLATKEMKITQRVQKELPDFFKDNFVHIASADANRRYSFVKRLADEETKNNWECKIMQSYYDNEFGN